MQKFLDSFSILLKWSKAMQFPCTTSAEICNTSANYKIKKNYLPCLRLDLNTFFTAYN